MNPPFTPEETFRRLLDESSALLAAPQDAGVVIPDDELHREILLPLLPAMLGDGTIRKHWHNQAATGFLARLTRHLQDGEAAPTWQPADFEIHVTASYSAGPDAKALADTLLSEDSLRDMSAALMNQILAAVWPKLELPAVPVIPAEVEAAAAPLPELDSEPVTEPANGHLAEAIAEPPNEPVAEPAAEPVSEPVSAAVAEPVAETVPVGEPAVEAVPEPELSAPTEEATPVTLDAARASLALPPLPAAEGAASSEIEG